MYSMYIGMIGKSKGSTVDSLAYRAGVKLECGLTGEIFNRASKDVEDVILSLPKDAPEWAQDLKDLIAADRTKGLQAFCNLVEGAEGRKDSQVYREFRLSLPREFSKDQSKELVKEFLADQVCAHGITALENYHFDVDKVTGEENPHCHVLLLTRRLTESGLGLKERSWNTKQYHEQWRSQWAAYGNYHLLKNGLEANWDHRSYKDQGINFEPQPKLGSKIIKMERQAGQDPKDIHSKPVTEKGREYQEVKLRNLYTLINRPEEALDAVSKQQVTFMWGDVAKIIARYVDDQALFERLSLKIQNSPELVCLKKESSLTESIFTTRTRLAEEKKFVDTIHALKGNETHGVNASLVEASIEKANVQLRESTNDPKASLSDDQVNAIKHMSLANQLSFVEGYAGAGKTTVMKVMKEIWETSGYQVFGLAPTGKAAENLADCGISSNTVHSFLKSFDKGRNQYESGTIIVLDEAGMVDHQRFHGLIQAVEKLGIKLVASGDRGQLSPVEAGVPFRLAIAEAGKADLTTVLRQQVPWQKDATVLFGQGRAEEALKAYLDKGHIHFCEEKKPLDVVERYNLSRRIAGNMGHEIQRDITIAKERGESLTFSSHADYGLFLAWKNTRDACVKDLYGNIDTYRDQMRNLGVDGIDFAKKVMKCRLAPFGDAYALAKDLQIDWRDKAKHSCDPRFETKQRLIADWFQSTKTHPLDSQAMMAFSNKDVQELNGMARDLKRGAGELGKEEYIYTIERNAGEELGKPQTVREERRFSVGDQIVFTKIDKGLGVNNGTLGRVTELNKSNIKVSIEKEGVPQEISFSPTLYNRFDNGWAVTIHKNQGATVDLGFVLASFEQYKNLAYVALTRHAKNVQVYASRFEFWRDEKLPERLGHAQDKLSSLDYVSSDRALELLQSDEKMLSSSLKKVGQRLEAVGYVGQRAWSTVCDKVLGRPLESNLVRIDQDIQGLKSESDRASEKFNAPAENGVGDHGQAPHQSLSKAEGDQKVKGAEGGNVRETALDVSHFKDMSQTYHPYEKETIQEIQGSIPCYRSALQSIFEGTLSLTETPKEEGTTVSLGGVVLEKEGANKGQWHVRDLNIRGDTIADLISFAHGLDKEKTFEWALSLCDSFDYGRLHMNYHEGKAARLSLEKEWKDRADKKTQDIHGLLEKTIPIQGTPAETYLRRERGIQGDLSESLRYLPAGISVPYGDQKIRSHKGGLVSLAKDGEGTTKAIQITSLTPEGERAKMPSGEKYKKMSYGSVKGSFVALQKGDDKRPIILAEGVETALSVQETGIKGSVYCSLGTSNINNLEVKDRDVILVGDWDGSQDKPSWALTEKAKASLEDKGNRVCLIYPVETEKLNAVSTPEKIDFNDLLTRDGLESVQARVYEQVPAEMAPELSRRENQKGLSDDKTNSLSSNTTKSDPRESQDSTKDIQKQENPLEKGHETIDWEDLRKSELFPKQYDLVIAHRQSRGKPVGAFQAQFLINQEQALNTVTRYDPSVKPLLEKAHFESLREPCVVDGHIDQEATLNRQYQLVIDYKSKVGKSTKTLESQFKENPEAALKVQVAWDKNIQLLLDPNASPEDALKFLTPPVERKEPQLFSTETMEISTEKTKEVELETVEEKSQEKQRSQGLSL